MSNSSTGDSDSRKSVSTVVKPCKVEAIGYRFGESSHSPESLRPTARSPTETHDTHHKQWKYSTASERCSDYFRSSGYYSNSWKALSRKSSCPSKSDKMPLSTPGSSSSRDVQRNKTEDGRYHASSFGKVPLSVQRKDHDPRYYGDSSYYR